MPYIKEENRQKLDKCIENLVDCLRPSNTSGMDTILGDINYCFTRVLAGLMEDVNYNKIAMITGVLENIKQEFYRRVASPYEDKKIVENGDVKEYKRIK
jgi:hypothetical protein